MGIKKSLIDKELKEANKVKKEREFADKLRKAIESFYKNLEDKNEK